MSLGKTVFLVYAAILSILETPVYSTKNLTANLPETLYTCACDPPCEGKTVCHTTGKCYIHKDKQTGLFSRNCFLSMEQSHLSCYSIAEYGLFKCCEGNMCNENMIVDPPPSKTVDKASDFKLVIIISVSIALSACVLVIAAIYLVRRLVRKRRAESLLLAPEVRLLEDDSLCRGFHPGLKQDQWSSGSGSGQPTLVPRTVGKQVTLIERIGKGRFGEVWRGKWLDEDVAVKTFSSLEENSWNQETEIYNTGMLHHENILGYYASDTVGILSCTQNWLILQYHRNGSLYDYLQRSDLDIEEMLLLAHSAASGLAHLHTEIKEGTGKHEKPGIAHRDIKSKNILVKDNGQCCIGDLGHAVRSNCLKTDAGPDKLLVGTKRYMAPEVLTETLNADVFESFKCVDVYAFGLVLWELARRARPFAEEYRIPFWDIVPADPSFEDMKRVVAGDRLRPLIPNKWAKEPMMCEIARLICECWAHNPKVRLTILRVKKNLLNMLKATSGDNSEKLEKLSARIVESSSRSSSGNSSGNFSGHL
ncbi:hypothetical protein BsWGS_25095 [Bradybaena similaris]